MTSIYQSLKADFLRILIFFGKGANESTMNESIVPSEPSISPVVAPGAAIVPIPNPDALLPWTTPDNCRHNVRALADLEGLSEDQKNLMSQVIHCESNYNPACVHKNIVNGVVASTDNGICQWNDYYHGSEITPDQALNNPEMAVRLMCTYMKQGLIKEWVCFSKAMYLQYSS